MHISASIRNSLDTHEITVSTEGQDKQVAIPSRGTGYGSSVNGGEMLFLALATCCCNDVYREAAKREMTIESVDVVVNGHFGKEGEPASGITYSVQVVAPDHSGEEISSLIRYVDEVAEVHNTLRKGVKVSLKQL